MTSGRGFPFADEASRFSLRSGAVVAFGCALGLMGFFVAPRILPGWPGRWLAAALLPALPLGALALATGRRWRTIFHPLTGRDVGWALVFVLPTSLLPAGLAYMALGSNLTAANPAAELLPKMRAADQAAFFAGTIPQLLGEELVTILPFLIMLSALRGTLPVRGAVLLAGLLSSLLFGALHLSTYGWSLFNALIVIGLARLSLTACYIVTKNVWASFVTHLVNDWLLFGAVLAAAALER